MTCGSPGASLSALTNLTRAEPRTEEEYEQEVDAYLAEIVTSWPDIRRGLAAPFVGVPSFVVVNGSQRNYQKLELSLHVDGDADAEEHEEYNDGEVLFHDFLPDGPRLWGPTSLVDLRMPFPGIGLSPARGPFTQIQRGGSFTLTFVPVDLRPGGSAVLEDMWAILIPATRTEPVLARWTATCLNVDATATGAVPIHFEGPEIDPIEALAARAERRCRNSARGVKPTSAAARGDAACRSSPPAPRRRPGSPP